MIRRHLMALGLAASAVFATPAFAEEARPMNRTISLSGHGEVRGRPDLAVVNLGVLSTAETARAALDANNRTMGEVLAAVAAAGIAGKDVQTSNFMVAARYDYNSSGGQPPRTVGYDVSNTVMITLRKIETLGVLLDQVVTVGSNQINGVTFQIANPQPLEDEARKLAVADAARKAALYAAAAGVTLGSIVSISEGAAYQPPMPMRAVAMESAKAGAVPVAEGEQAVAMDVNVVWELK